MKLIYGIRSSMYYPFRGGEAGRCLPPPGLRKAYLDRIKDMGCDGLELGVDALGGLDVGKNEIQDLRKELEDAGLPCLAMRTKGGLHEPGIADQNRAYLDKGVQFAGWIGAEIVDLTVTAIPKGKRSGFGQGEAGTTGSSRDAADEDYEVTAKGIAEAADAAAGLGVAISIEVHHASIVDNSSSAIRMLELVDRPNVGVNPDLGNTYWTYDLPEEGWDDVIVTLAPYASYWHCKNVTRVHIAEARRSIFLKEPLPDGDINYRFAVAAMLDAGYKGFMAIEGMNSGPKGYVEIKGLREGDQLYKDERSAQYARALIEEWEAGNAQSPRTGSGSAR